MELRPVARASQGVPWSHHCRRRHSSTGQASTFCTASGSLAEVWWPPFGEDVSVASMPRRPGKAVCLEIKTASVEVGRHLVDIDLKQLGAYLRQPLRNQPFYVFPLPRWTGCPGLLAVPVSIGLRRWLRPSELAFSRAGSGGWFCLKLDLRADGQGSGGSSRDGRRRLPGWRAGPSTGYRVDRPGHGRPPGGLNAAGTPVLRSWASFWTLPASRSAARLDWPQTLLAKIDAPHRSLREQYASTATPRLRPFSRRTRRSTPPSLFSRLNRSTKGYRVLTLEAALGEDTPTA